MTNPVQSLLSPERAQRESFAAYRARRAHANAYIKRAKRGTLVWFSAKLGTFTNPARAAKKAARAAKKAARKSS